MTKNNSNRGHCQVDSHFEVISNIINQHLQSHHRELCITSDNERTIAILREIHNYALLQYHINQIEQLIGLQDYIPKAS